MSISTLIWTTLDNAKATLSFSTSIFTTLGNVETTSSIWTFERIKAPPSLKKATILKFNVYYVTQGNYSSFSPVATFTPDWLTDWLTDGTSLIKTKLNRLISSVCFRVRLIPKKAKHGNYSVKVHSEKYSTWYMKTIWKIQYKFADAKINWLTGWYLARFTRYFTVNISYRKRQHVFSAFSFYKH